MLIAPDTNVLVRIFLDDTSNSKQVLAARNLAKKAKQLYITQIVQVELIWVLESAYTLKKNQIIAILEKLQNHSIFILQNADIFHEAVTLYQLGIADFSDYLILVEAKHTHAQFYTFDKNLIKSGAKQCEID